MEDTVYSMQSVEKCCQVASKKLEVLVRGQQLLRRLQTAVVNGATSATQKAVEGAVNEAINKVKVLG